MENVVKATAQKKKGNVRKLTSLGMLAAISIILVATVHFPLIPAAPFLEYDPADVPILIGTFAFGPVAGFLLTVVVSVIQGATVSAASGGFIGVIMHIFATGSCVLVAGNIYNRNKTKKTAAIALVIGALVMTAAMVVMNLIFTPIFMGAPMETVIAMLIPAIIPFNLLKAGINCAITFLLYKSISHLLKGE
ncbi:ECF transporter S component [Anaerotignum lactatifermentans]|uniref:Riboflavin transporter n=1 Tax=Anaerotignum lactatifermentans TaxID=160404 RepID=A0ABS2GCC5_9FIRM|nr:ECF transporter S component [Anaerotignum lactatifermentans]MBM6829945.1 ECF transporter S component [Anaerotignum lactatifermentans]MBM6878448.1 ECF transporter S component [Anaerotignum lactatifermentans]MBM6951630.1 ECF transporter S component [Anaerotignum lactatifermentans]